MRSQTGRDASLSTVSHPRSQCPRMTSLSSAVRARPSAGSHPGSRACRSHGAARRTRWPGPPLRPASVRARAPSRMPPPHLQRLHVTGSLAASATPHPSMLDFTAPPDPYAPHHPLDRLPDETRRTWSLNGQPLRNVPPCNTAKSRSRTLPSRTKGARSRW